MRLKPLMINSRKFQLPKFFHPPQPGNVINQYLIGESIGQGSFGRVYECQDEWENELVAKVLVPQNRSYEQVQQEWSEELNKLVDLRHPNITYVYDAFEYCNTFYLIIERCHCTLKELLEMPDLAGEILLPCLARELLCGIHFMHSAGYVHKDIHSGNVFVSLMYDRLIPNKEPVFMFKIGDLGISRLENDINIFNTILAEWMRPPESLAPEEYGRIGRQVDIYHTGLLLLSLLIGDIPSFTDEEILAGKPRQLAESLSSPYKYAIARALRRHVADRTQTALDFWREISQASKLQQ
ncbi:serine/threonine protein kinase [Nostoc sp.]|uniref:serine/threonine protein kinase n=1 Tax=Nostoc sp. TaxID=1180 RepID=UPI002FF6D7FC